MTVSANGRLAGAAYIIYFVAGIASMAVPAETRGIFNAVTSFSALTLGVTLYALTRAIDRDLAMIAMGCRLIEAVPGNGEIYFAGGSTIFCWLLLRGRLIPRVLAWLGFISSAMLVVLLAVQLTTSTSTDWSAPITWFVWLPTLIFELTFAAWLLTKGIAAPRDDRGQTPKFALDEG
jgi:hypothetical protein